METVDEALDDAEMDASADATSETLRDGHEGHEDELDIVHETVSFWFATFLFFLSPLFPAFVLAIVTDNLSII